MTSDLKPVVKQKYGEAAIRARSAAQISCCETPGCQAKGELVTSSFYDDADQRLIPDEALLASLGCGNPTALAELKSGETVLDLGSGGGIDVLLSARRVGPNGKAYGLDMTDVMLALARDNQQSVLKPSGRLAVSDVVVRGEVPLRCARACCSGWAAARAP